MAEWTRVELLSREEWSAIREIPAVVKGSNLAATLLSSSYVSADNTPWDAVLRLAHPTTTPETRPMTLGRTYESTIASLMDLKHGVVIGRPAKEYTFYSPSRQVAVTPDGWVLGQRSRKEQESYIEALFTGDTPMHATEMEIEMEMETGAGAEITGELPLFSPLSPPLSAIKDSGVSRAAAAAAVDQVCSLRRAPLGDPSTASRVICEIKRPFFRMYEGVSHSHQIQMFLEMEATNSVACLYVAGFITAGMCYDDWVVIANSGREADPLKKVLFEYSKTHAKGSREEKTLLALADLPDDAHVLAQLAPPTSTMIPGSSMVKGWIVHSNPKLQYELMTWAGKVARYARKVRWEMDSCGQSLEELRAIFENERQEAERSVKACLRSSVKIELYSPEALHKLLSMPSAVAV